MSFSEKYNLSNRSSVSTNNTTFEQLSSPFNKPISSTIDFDKPVINDETKSMFDGLLARSVGLSFIANNEKSTVSEQKILNTLLASKAKLMPDKDSHTDRGVDCMLFELCLIAYAAIDTLLDLDEYIDDDTLEYKLVTQNKCFDVSGVDMRLAMTSLFQYVGLFENIRNELQKNSKGTSGILYNVCTMILVNLISSAQTVYTLLNKTKWKPIDVLILED